MATMGYGCGYAGQLLRLPQDWPFDQFVVDQLHETGLFGAVHKERRITVRNCDLDGRSRLQMYQTLYVPFDFRQRGLVDPEIITCVILY